MCTHDKYRMIRMNDHVREIEKAIYEAKGKRELSVKDFLPR